MSIRTTTSTQLQGLNSFNYLQLVTRLQAWREPQWGQGNHFHGALHNFILTETSCHQLEVRGVELSGCITHGRLKVAFTHHTSTYVKLPQKQDQFCFCGSHRTSTRRAVCECYNNIEISVFYMNVYVRRRTST